MGRWTVVIRHWRPHTDNQLARRRRGKIRMKKEDRKAVAAWAFAVVPRAEGKRRVRLTVVQRDARHRPDPTNLWKSLLDALVHCKLLIDDSAEWCEAAPAT